MLIAFHKPYGVLSQFTSDGSPNRTLAEFKFPKGVYPIGRLDTDWEGLLLLSDERQLAAPLPRRNAAVVRARSVALLRFNFPKPAGSPLATGVWALKRPEGRAPAWKERARHHFTPGIGSFP